MLVLWYRVGKHTWTVKCSQPLGPATRCLHAAPTADGDSDGDRRRVERRRICRRSEGLPPGPKREHVTLIGYCGLYHQGFMSSKSITKKKKTNEDKFMFMAQAILSDLQKTLEDTFAYI